MKQGGSYTKDLKTGELTLIQRTKPAEPEKAKKVTADKPKTNGEK